nr:Os03g0413250 [Ipomoea batatas]GMD87857.1 Os03g0413250 [Ipomoea batatas]
MCNSIGETSKRSSPLGTCEAGDDEAIPLIDCDDEWIRRLRTVATMTVRTGWLDYGTYVYQGCSVTGRVQSGVEHDILHIRERANDIEQKLRPVLALNVHNRIAFLQAIQDRDHGDDRLIPLVIPVRKHHLVKPPLRVRVRHGNARPSAPDIVVSLQNIP